jgi:hypothetical protein
MLDSKSSIDKLFSKDSKDTNNTNTKPKAPTTTLPKPT